MVYVGHGWKLKLSPFNDNSDNLANESPSLLMFNAQVKVVEETIRYIDQLHRMLAKRVQADDIRK